MTSLDPRPGMVALIQAASYLPVAIFVLPAGVVADVFDRRTVIVISQLLLCAVGIALGVLTHLGALHPWGLIALCLAGGIVAAFAQPAWQAREQLHGSPSYYGALLGCLGAGAIIGAFMMPRLRMHLAGGKLVRIGSLVSAAMTIVFALTTNQHVAAIAAVIAGTAWMTVVTTFPLAAQALLPNRVRARGMAFYLLAFYGSLALGSVIWGQVAHASSLGTALLASAVLGAILALAAERLPWPVDSASRQASS